MLLFEKWKKTVTKFIYFFNDFIKKIGLRIKLL